MFIFGLIILVFTLGCMFIKYLIDAIRAKDEDNAFNNKFKACFCFGLLNFFWSILILNMLAF